MYRTLSRALLFGALVGLALPVSAQSLSSGDRASGPSVERAAPLAPQTLTHSLSQAITTNQLGCQDTGTNAATENFHIREFDLAADFGVVGDFDVSNVEIGIERADAPSGSQPVELRLYTKDPADALIFANLTPLATSPASVPNQTFSFFDFPVAPAATVPAGQVLVVAIYTPDGRPDGNIFYIGGNQGGETDPSYIAAVDCGVPEPLSWDDLAFDMDVVMNVTGDDATSGGVTIDYLGSTDTPQRNDYVFIRALATNSSASTIRTRIYFTVDYPDGATRTYSVLSSDFPGGTSFQVQQIKRMRFPIPADAPAGTYTVTIYAADDIASGGTIYDSDSFTFDLHALPTKAGDLASGVDAGPNPFTSETTIRYELAEAAEVDLRVFDVTGREVAQLATGTHSAGAHSALFAAGDLPGGVYVWRLAVGGEVTTGRVTLAR